MVYTIDPLRDPRWTELLARHESSSLFHSKPWLEAVNRTYGYRPIVYTTSAPTEPMSNGIVLCGIKSWLTGCRLVSVPFSDHCDPLLDGLDAATMIGQELKRTVDSGEWGYVELRPRSEHPQFDDAARLATSFLHTLDLQPPLEAILRKTHKTAVQQPIKRAEREGLVYRSGNSEPLLAAFYGLLVQTRRKHQLPPQPVLWFRNLAACLGERLQIRVAFKGERPVASILTIQHENTVVYKYGCSNPAFQNLGGTPLLLWRTIVEAKAAGLKAMDFGRSDADNPGLIAFKDRWGATSTDLIYLRWSRKGVSSVAKPRISGAMKHLFALMPDAVLRATGHVLYRHAG